MCVSVTKGFKVVFVINLNVTQTVAPMVTVLRQTHASAILVGKVVIQLLNVIS